jgi:hypothetical protein
MIKINDLQNGIRISISDENNELMLVGNLPDNTKEALLAFLISGYYKSPDDKILITKTVKRAAKVVPEQFIISNNSYEKETLLNLSEAVLDFLEITNNLNTKHQSPEIKKP